MKVQFLKNTAAAIVGEYPQDTILIYRQGYDLPALTGVKYVDFENFRLTYQTIHANMFIVVGLNRIINPSNRCDFIFEYLQTMTPHIPKISIDTAPFVGEPWRLWYHYSIANCGKFNINYSYAIETEWKHWFYRETNDCRFDGENIGLFVTDTYSDLDKLTAVFSFYEPSIQDLEYYKEAKKFVFDKYATPKLWVNNLLKLCNKHFSVDLDFDSYLTNKKYHLPDLKIYRFIVDENLRRMGTYNAVIS